MKIPQEDESILALLNQKAEAISFPSLLSRLYHGKEPLKKKLSDRLEEYDRLEGVDKPDQEQTARKIRYWFSGQTLPGSREELFRICFALDFSIEESEALFCATAESGVHYRNPKELIYAYCLKYHLDYPKARSMAWRFFADEESLPLKTGEYELKVRESSRSESYQTPTVSIRNEFKYLNTEEKLFSFLDQHRSSFGFHHNTAYSKFCLMLNYLMECGQDNPTAGLPAEKKYRIQRTVEEYLRMGIAVSEDDFVEEHCMRINLMLADSGMALLNVHNPFDYLILQCLCLEDEDDFMSNRMERFLYKIFKKQPNPAYIKFHLKNRSKARYPYESEESSF